MTNIRSPWQGGGLWPTPDGDKFCRAIWCDGECGKELVHYLKTTKLFREMKDKNK